MLQMLTPFNAFLGNRSIQPTGCSFGICAQGIAAAAAVRHALRVLLLNALSAVILTKTIHSGSARAA